MKRILCLFLAISMMFSIMPLSAHAAKTAPLQIGVIADIHYYPAELTGNYCPAFMDYSATNTRQEGQSEALLESALDAVALHARQNGLKYLLLPGDTTRDGEYIGNKSLAKRLERFERETGIQVIATNGNHDINNSAAATFENGVKEKAQRTTPEDWLELYQNLGFDLAYNSFTPSGGKKGGMLSYSVRLDGGYRLIVMDSGKYSWDNTSDGDDEHEGEGNYPPELMAWILAQAADAKACGETVIGMTHHSLVPHSAIEPTVMPTLILDNYLEVSEKLADTGMRAVFTGHMHQSDVATGYADSGESLTDIATASLSGYPNTFREVLFNNANSGFSADIKTFDVDCVSPVVFSGVPYARPYRDTFSFLQSFGHDGLAAYGADMVNKVVAEYLNKMKQQGLLNMLKGMGVDVEKTLGKGLTGFIDDLGKQIITAYADNPQRLQAVIEKCIDKVAFMKVSELPSTKFLASPGFGDAGRGGNFEEFGMSLVVYMFGGDEDLSDDAFMRDVLAKFENGSLTNQLLGILADVILNDLLKDELLSTLQIRPSAFIADDALRAAAGAFVNLLLQTLLGGNASYTSLINAVSCLGLMQQAKANKLLGGALNIYAAESGFGDTLALWVQSLLIDSNPGIRQDGNAKLTYSGPVPVTPSQENFRLPSEISVSNTKNTPADKKVTWFTKSSVTGSDIEILSKSKNPVFRGQPTLGAGQPTLCAGKTEITSRKYYALNLSGIGILPYQLNQAVHTVELKGLEPNKRYLYRVGDASKGWWSETKELNTFYGGFSAAADNLSAVQCDELLANLKQILAYIKTMNIICKT